MPLMQETTSPSLRELFDACIELPAAARLTLLTARCSDATLRARVERLLTADAGDDALFAGGAPAAARAIGVTDATLPPGSRVGPFEIIDVLGEGGSSTVFRAQRESAGVRQQVALKILFSGLYSADAQRQFRRERTALAQLTHPGIARLIEGGVTENGIAYIALELVEGQPITHYARDWRLDVRERLALFLQVCRAVEAAHRALIVHRDLKPSNVFVAADGNVKLLDFGIAKLLHVEDEERTRLPMLTPAYAAPEQHANGPITTATDVYALGVLLGELLTGRRLQGNAARAPSSQIDGDAAAGVLPLAPAQTRRALRGDLDNIILKAIDTLPERRYASAGAFAEDIERLQSGRPVAAHPPSRLYRIRKFIQRYRAGVAFALIFLVAVLASLGVALWQARVARLELRRADAMRDFMAAAFVEAEPGSPREGPPRITDVAEKAITLARNDARMDAGVRAELLNELGAMLRHQGHLQPARDTLQWNYDQARAAFGDAAPLTLAAGYQLVHSLDSVGDFDGARRLNDRMLELAPAQTDIRRDLLSVSAMLATRHHDAARALADAGAAVKLARDGADPSHIAEALSYLSLAQLSAGDVRGAIVTSEEQLALRMQQYGPQHLSVSTAHATLSRAYRRAGDINAAEQHILAALAIDEAVLPANDWRHSRHLNALMALRLEQRDFRAALEAASEGLRIDRIAYGDDHAEVANGLAAVGAIELKLEDYNAALPPLRELIQRTEGKASTGRDDTSSPHINYALALAHSGHYDEGRAELERVVAALGDSTDPAQQAEACAKFAELLLEFKTPAAALPVLDKLDRALALGKMTDSSDVDQAILLRANALLQLHRAADAHALLASSDDATRQFSDAVARVEAPLLQAVAAQQLQDFAAAARFAQTGFTRLNALRNPPSRLTRLGADVRRDLGSTPLSGGVSPAD
jgi:eukaryotic-like serine/threonine-protein kinase